MKICLQVVHAASDLFWLGRSLTYVVYLVCTHFLLFWGFYLWLCLSFSSRCSCSFLMLPVGSTDVSSWSSDLIWVLILLNWCKLISFITATILKVTGSWSGHSWVKVNLLHFFSVSQRIHTSLICHGKLQRTQVRPKHGSHLLTDTWGNHLFCFWGLFFCCFQVSIPHIFHVHTVDICVCRSLIG